MTTTDRDGLLAAVRADPDDLTAQLALADCLEETGEDDRAELVRVTCELAGHPPRPRELFVADGAGTRMEGLGVALIYHGDGHYSASTGERGLSIELFSVNERVDIYAEIAGKKGPKWMRGLRYVKHVPEREIVIFRRDDKSGPWSGTLLTKRQRDLEAKLAVWSCPECGGAGDCFDDGDGIRSIENCPACGGTGDVLRVREWQHVQSRTVPFPVTFLGGYPWGVTMPRLEELVREERVCKVCLDFRKIAKRLDRHNYCDRCDATNGPHLTSTIHDPTPRLCALAANPPWGVPLEWACVEDWEPVKVGDSGYAITSENNGRRLPETIAKQLYRGPVPYVHPTATAARRALGRLIVKFGRGE